MGRYLPWNLTKHAKTQHTNSQLSVVTDCWHPASQIFGALTWRLNQRAFQPNKSDAKRCKTSISPTFADSGSRSFAELIRKELISKEFSSQCRISALNQRSTSFRCGWCKPNMCMACCAMRRPHDAKSRSSW